MQIEDESVRKVSESETFSGKLNVANSIAIAKEFYRRFQETESLMRATSLAFTCVFSLIPLLLLGLALLGFLIPSPGEATAYLTKLVSQFLPGKEAAAYAKDTFKLIGLEEIAQSLRSSSLFAILFGTLAQLWTGISLFVSVSTNLNLCWDLKETRDFVRLRLVCLGVFAGVLALFLISLIPSFFLDFLLSLPAVQGKLTGWESALINAGLAIVVVFIDIGIFVLIYQALPDTKVPIRAALVGGGITGILWEAFKRLFSLYLSHFGNYSKLYGALGTVALLVTWISYSCIILLAGGIMCKMADERISATSA